MKTIDPYRTFNTTECVGKWWIEATFIRTVIVVPCISAVFFVYNYENFLPNNVEKKIIAHAENQPMIEIWSRP